jgi:hypothetical protein
LRLLSADLIRAVLSSSSSAWVVALVHVSCFERAANSRGRSLDTWPKAGAP